MTYGSLSTRNRGYELLGRSAGCDPAQVAEVITACRRYGQPPNAAASRPAWFALRLPAGLWAVVTVDPQGVDDQGRPGALIFDAVLIPKALLAGIGYNVAAFVVPPRSADRPADIVPAILPPRRLEIDEKFAYLPSSRPVGSSPEGPKVAAIVAALTKGRKVAIEADGPIDDLIGFVWAQLPPRVRRRLSVATWAFGAENRFDLMAVPRLAGVALDPSYLPPEALKPPATASQPTPGSARSGRSFRARLTRRGDRRDPIRAVPAPGPVAIGLGGMALVGVAAVFWASSVRERGRLLPPDPSPAGHDMPVPTDEDFTPAARAGVLGDLRALGERFRGFDLGDPGDPAAFLSRFADALHYHGPLLSEAESGRLRSAASGSPDAARALRWHEQVRAFRDDQPWPARFADLALAGQLRALGRSFHLGPEVEPEAIPRALMTHLSRPEAVAASPLGTEFPALGSYARFLARLPRRDETAEPGRADR